jgi:glycosyltransferase involved in cell wall biosynthesis
MAAGVPVVAAEVGGNLELVKHGVTGFLVPPENEIEFSAALEKLVTEPELRQRFGRCARERAQATYSIAKVRDCYQDMYQSLLTEKGWVATAANEQTVGAAREGL